MTTAIQLSELRKQFASDDIEWRIGQSGTKKNGEAWAKVLAYVTNRAIQNRLDDVCGPENWRNEYRRGPDGGVLCGISIRIDGEWITKFDGAPNTEFEAIKGGLSDAMKRSAVQWGIGRYLYDLGESWATFARDGEKAKYKAKIDGQWLSWSPPTLPAWALPSDSSGAAKSNGNGVKQSTQEEAADRFDREIAAAADMAALKAVAERIRVAITDDLHKAALRDLYTARAAELANKQLDILDAAVD